MKSSLSWILILVVGLAAGILIGRQIAIGQVVDFLSIVAIFEAGVIAGISLLLVGVWVGATKERRALADSSSDTSIDRSKFDERVSVSNLSGGSPSSLFNFVGYELPDFRFPDFSLQRLPFTLSFTTDQIPLVTAASITLAALAQYTFSQPNASGREGVLIYLISMLMFLVAIRHIENGSESGWGAKIRNDVEAPSLKPSMIQTILLVLSVFAIFAALLNPDLTRYDQDQSWNVVLWILGIAAFSLAYLPWSEFSHRPSHKLRLVLERALGVARPHRGELAAVAAILLLAFLTRAYDLSQIPRAFGGDEGEMGVSALDALYGRLINPFITGWMSMPTMYAYAQSLSIRLLGPTVFGIRMYSVFLGTLSVLFTWLLVRELFGSQAALMSAVLLAVYAAHVHFSRTANPQIQDGLTIVASLYFLYKGLVSRTRFYFVVAGLVVGFGVYGYQGGRLFAPFLFLLLFLFWLTTNRRLITGNIANLASMLFAGVIVASPLLLFYSNQPSAFTSRLAEVNILTNGYLALAAQSSQGPAGFVIEQIRSSFLAFNLVPENTGFYGLGAPMLDPLSAFFFVFGLTYCIWRIRSEPYFMILGWFLFGVIFGGVLIADPPTSHRLEIVFVPVIICVALGVIKMVELVSESWVSLKKFKWVAMSAVTIILVLVNVKGYFVDYTPKQIYGGDAALAATELGEFFLAYPQPFKAYVLGDVAGFVRIGTLRYMDPGLNAASIDDKLTGLPTFVDASRNALFVIFPTRTGELDWIRQGFPGGASIQMTRSDGRPLFLIYEVTHS